MQHGPLATTAPTAFLRWASSPGHRPPLGCIRLAALCISSEYSIFCILYRTSLGLQLCHRNSPLTLSLVIGRCHPGRLRRSSEARVPRFRSAITSELLANSDYVANDRQSRLQVSRATHSRKMSDGKVISTRRPSSGLADQARPTNRLDWAVREETVRNGCCAESHAVTSTTSTTRSAARPPENSAR